MGTTFMERMPLRARPFISSWFSRVTKCLVLAMSADAADTNAPNGLKPHQAISPVPPPRSPPVFDPDPNKLLLQTNRPPDTNWSRIITVNSNPPPAASYPGLCRSNQPPSCECTTSARSLAPWFCSLEAIYERGG